MTASGDSQSIREILDFWFLPLDDPEHGKPRKIWWDSTPEFDAESRTRFGALVDKAIAGELDPWRKSPDGALALVLLCDQFPRNIHRRTRARLQRRRQGARDRALRHRPQLSGRLRARHARCSSSCRSSTARSSADQEFCCALFATLGDENNDKYANEHRDIVARFGRFPHRNEVLGRESTAEELDYLKTAKRFGQ